MPASTIYVVSANSSDGPGDGSSAMVTKRGLGATEELCALAERSLPVEPTALEAHLAAAEDASAPFSPGCSKTIVWADSTRKTKTPLCVLFLHGNAMSAVLVPISTLDSPSHGPF